MGSFGDRFFELRRACEVESGSKSNRLITRFVVITARSAALSSSDRLSAISFSVASTKSSSVVKSARAVVLVGLASRGAFGSAAGAAAQPVRRPRLGFRRPGWRATVVRPSRCLTSGPRLPRDDGQIGTSVGGAGALHDIERTDRTAKTLQLQVSEVFELGDRFDRFSDAAADRDLPSLASSQSRAARLHTVPIAV
jgi:hypothetical protein